MQDVGNDEGGRGGWVQYYDKEYNNKKQKEHRRYKYELLKNSI